MPVYAGTTRRAVGRVPAPMAPLLAVLFLTPLGCSWQDDNAMASTGPHLVETIQTLPPLEIPTATAPAPDRDAVLEAYRTIYGAIPDPQTDQAIGKRLADLEMSLGEDLDVAGEPQPYQAAIGLYESLLGKSESGSRDEILYQLARANDLAGNGQATVRYLDRLIVDHPDSPYQLEARFRRAEIAFSEKRYREAAGDYAQVVASGADTAYWQNANYMRGWSLFKLSDLEACLPSFFAVIDGLVPADAAAPLPATDRELLDDSFRVVTLALGYLDGPSTLAAKMSDLGEPRWQYLAYQALAEDYLGRERYLDSVATWQTFIDRNPLDPRAPDAHIGMIRTLEEADFPSEVRPKKEMFVRAYGISSEFWAVHDGTVRAGYLDMLRRYLDELSRLTHGEAQQSRARADYLAAAGWYEERVATFPDDPSAAETLFLLGEVYTEAEAYSQAVAAYQIVVRQYPHYPRAREAGYAAILGLETLAEASEATAALDGKPAAEAVADGWSRRKVDAQVEFARVFPEDPRASQVLADAAESLFQLGEYVESVALAEELLSVWPDLSGPLRTTALLVLGHGRFELGEYAAAEGAYGRLLNTELADVERDGVTERLLAAIYKQGEASEAEGDPDLAISHYLRLREVDPTAQLAIQGHYDAVAVAQSVGRMEEAAALLAEFRDRYPDHELGRDAARRLAAMYEETGAPARAASEYVRLAETDGDPEIRRQSRYRAAELYLLLDDISRAVAQFDAYARTYPDPADLRLEAVHHLDQLHQQLGDAESRRYWQEQKVAIHRGMAEQATERSTFLAAEAQYALAEHQRDAFDAIRLTHPLKRSLESKQKALEQTVRAFEAAAAYGVGDFVSASTFQIADLYSALSLDLLASERPEGLSALEREQYEILLEEQAFPFEEQAISLHEINMRRSWAGSWDPWIEKSFVELGRLMPARFDKPEVEVAYVQSIH